MGKVYSIKIRFDVFEACLRVIGFYFWHFFAAGIIADYDSELVGKNYQGRVIIRRSS